MSNIHALPTAKPFQEARDRLKKAVTNLLYANEGIQAYAVISIDGNGMTYITYFVDSKSAIPRRLLPAYLSHELHHLMAEDSPSIETPSAPDDYES